MVDTSANKEKMDAKQQKVRNNPTTEHFTAFTQSMHGTYITQQIICGFMAVWEDSYVVLHSHNMHFT